MPRVSLFSLYFAVVVVVVVRHRKYTMHEEFYRIDLRRSFSLFRRPEFWESGKEIIRLFLPFALGDTLMSPITRDEKGEKTATPLFLL